MNDSDHPGRPRRTEPGHRTRLTDVAAADTHDRFGPTNRRSAITAAVTASHVRATDADSSTSPGPLRDELDNPGGPHHASDERTPSNPSAAEPPPALFTPAQAAQLLQVRESWLRRRAAQRRIPCTFLGKHLRFSPADLNQIITDAARPTTDRQQTPQPGTRSPSPPRMTSRTLTARRRPTR
ncbi:helix-turn-helix domain-containing protein [Pseudonocardia sp. 73-21]|uniref:helix-turn-helix domain-containing protein n=1 Tax=Pseudonocardia sp. 73-21 TaxID=1895809 RepID=UPI00262A9DD7|nr:helix-turn-helix domain-containing protein [Pseudonocardia sp. 73-21]